MKYTKNIGNKLLLGGFKFAYNHADEEINCDVYFNGFVSVTVDHTNKEIVTYLSDYEQLYPSSLDQLLNLTNLLTKLTKK